MLYVAVCVATFFTPTTPDAGDPTAAIAGAIAADRTGLIAGAYLDGLAAVRALFELDELVLLPFAFAVAGFLAALILVGAPRAVQRGRGRGRAAGDRAHARPARALPVDPRGRCQHGPRVVLERYLNVYALPEAVVAACPTTYQGALQIRAVRA